MEKKENEYVDFIVTARKYKTQLTNKYKNRPLWQKPVPGEVLADLPGTIIKIHVKKGDRVKAGDLLLIHEAMKMLNRIVAPVSGVIADINVEEGERLGKGHLMVKIEPR